MRAVVDAVNVAHAIHEQPTVIIAHTIPGRGVSYMENDYQWHGIPPGISDIPGEPPKERQAKIALDDLRRLGGLIKSEHE